MNICKLLTPCIH